MANNPIPAIEEAELAAARTVQKAAEDKVSLIHAAREKADGDFAEAVRRAQAEGAGIIQAAELASRSDIATLDAGFEREKADLRLGAERGESAAISAIVDIVSGKTS